MTDYTVAAVDHALALLLLVAHSPGLGVSELAARSGNTKARTFRLLYTLEQRRLVQRRGRTAAYWLDVQALYLGIAAQEQVDLVRLARPYLLNLAAACNENVQIRVRDGLESVCVDRWQCVHHERIASRAGSRRRLHAGASCKLLLAYAPEDVRQALMASELPRYTELTIHQPSRLALELKRIRQQGLSLSCGEMTRGVSAFAVPIFDRQQQVMAALSISGPTHRLQARQAELMASLNTAAATITVAIQSA
ncbi:MAG: IclR family transcriptional regulator [Curvibacter lanceolatus]|jgi:DNA-binding IclR family transcriptional regulator|uniref:IclR family transcriptional regulator n=1 Tax=Curvibacter lanceolatus TaxID=86182 RepID=UPI00036A2645|nr:IclR family transcriptional regulator [Curvibacter lanceolatus]MBV5291655.1 IclR family transcriptional regulator [Curvibacter lanceolatus]